MKSSSVSRASALRWLAAAPAVAAGAAASLTAAEAADNKKQFKYQDKPGPKNEKCAACKFFKAPNGCTIVTGKISPNGWCVAWAKK
jgi:hypothetical protein